MKKFLMPGILIVLLFFRSEGALCLTWSQTGSPAGIQVIELLIDPSNPSILYAGTMGNGVYKSTDAGDNWAQVNNGLPDPPTPGCSYPDCQYTYALSMDSSIPTTLYVGTPGDGVYKTTDGGQNWISHNTGLTRLDLHMAPVVAPSNSSILYVGTEWGTDNSYIFKSEDGGEIWFSIHNNLPHGEVNNIAVDPADPSIVYAGKHFDSGYHDGGVYKSINGGQSWSSANNGLPNVTTPESGSPNFTFDPNNSQIIYVTNNGGVYKTIDAGQNWTAIGTGITNLPAHGLAIHPVNHDLLFVGSSGGGVFMSTDGGVNWTAENTGLEIFPFAGVAIDPLSPSTLYAAIFGDGIYKNDPGFFFGSYSITDYEDNNSQDGINLSINTTPAILTITESSDPQIFSVKYDAGEGRTFSGNHTLSNPNRIDHARNVNVPNMNANLVDSIVISNSNHMAWAMTTQELDNPLDIAISVSCWQRAVPVPPALGSYAGNYKIISYFDSNISDTSTGFQEDDRSGVFSYTLSANNTLTMPWADGDTQISLQVEGSSASLSSPITTGDRYLHALKFCFDQTGFSYFSIESSISNPTEIIATTGWGSPDNDSDGVVDSEDVCPGHDDTADIDNDGTPDGCDSLVDSDGDGVADSEDICSGHDDSVDADADGIPDGCDNFIDSDSDGVADSEDVCSGYDDSIDVDADGTPDGCDNLIDSDSDGVADAEDLCPGNDDNVDVDDDGTPDGCDVLIDSDGDGVADTEDLCSGYDDSVDVDGDGTPDGCDSLIDSDNDGVGDSEDMCPGHDDSVDVDADGIPDGCDELIDSDGDGIPDSEDDDSTQTSKQGFDYLAYLAANPDLPPNWGKAECMNHYKLYGFLENRAVTFNLEEYLNANPDFPTNWTLAEGLNHYNMYGKFENRILAFEAQEYLSLYPDLPQSWSYDEAYGHYVNYGQYEGRIASFDETAYLELYEDLPSSWGQEEAFWHYFLYGQYEGRVYDPYDEDVFDSN